MVLELSDKVVPILPSRERWMRKLKGDCASDTRQKAKTEGLGA